MIKLIDILKEMAISRAGTKSEIDRAIEAAKQIKENNPVLWRGMTKVPDPVNYVTVEDSRTFRGKNQGAAAILANIGESGVKNPVFAYFEKSLVEFFGKPCIIILERPYTMYQSPEVDDIKAFAQREIYKIEKKGGGEMRSQIGSRSDEEIERKAKEGAATYEEIDGAPLYKDREVVIDVKHYWAIQYGGDVKNYGQLVKLLETYRDKLTEPAEKVQEDEQQSLPYQEFVDLFRKKVESRKGTYDDSLFNTILADTQPMETKAEIVSYLNGLMDRTKDGKQRAYLNLLIQDCNSNFKPRWDFSKMKTTKKY